LTVPLLAPALATRYLDDDRTRTVARLLARIASKRDRNKRLSDYYDGKRQVQSLGVAVSPEFDKLETVVGWPGTVVDALNERRSIDYLDVPSSAEQTDMIRSVWDDNDLDAELGMARDDAAIHGITFVVVGQRDGRTIVLPTPATRMTCDYERAARRISVAVSDDGQLTADEPAMATLYEPDGTWVLKVRGSRYEVEQFYANPVGVVPVERFVNRPRHDKPWGRSEITPAVISYTDAAVRTLVSMEVSREFFAAPQRYALNIDPEAFIDSKTGDTVKAWETYWGRFIALTAAQNEEGQFADPTLGQLPASSPAPLVELMKMLSQMMTAETRMPPSLWGFVTDNPASGDGARMYENGLVLKAKARNRADRPPLARLSRLILLAEGVPVDDLPPAVNVEWIDPATYTPGAVSDAVSKQIASGALPADSDVALEAFGYGRTTVERIQSDRRKARAAAVVAGLSQLNQTPQVAPSADNGSAAAILAS
jgi:Phage portal protein, SPP1 Gp6-like